MKPTPHMGRIQLPQFLKNPFGALLTEAYIVGDDLSVTTVRTGARKSVDANTDGVVATNEVDTDLTNWNKVQIDGTISVSDQGAGIYRCTFNGTTDFGLSLRYLFTPTDAQIYTSKIQLRLVSGDPSALATGHACPLRYSGR